MAHFAQLDSNNNVIGVYALDNSMMLDENNQRSESKGIAFMQSLFGQDTIWKQTSYNTRAGIHYEPNSYTPSENQSEALRKNYAGIGWSYDPTRNAFINPKPIVHPEDEQYVTFDEFACLWEYNPPELSKPNIEVTRV
jgi:hypothetical protein